MVPLVLFQSHRCVCQNLTSGDYAFQRSSNCLFQSHRCVCQNLTPGGSWNGPFGSYSFQSHRCVCQNLTISTFQDFEWEASPFQSHRCVCQNLTGADPVDPTYKWVPRFSRTAASARTYSALAQPTRTINFVSVAPLRLPEP